MPRQISIVTPENVTIEYELAGLASRMGAAIIDTLLQLLVMGLLGWGFAKLASIDGFPSGGWFIAVVIVTEFLVFWGYSIFFETAWSGQTPGKRWLRLRAVRMGGLPIDFPCAAIRNLVRLVDYFLLGWAAILITGRNQRLGDLAAGTLVVKERTQWAVDLRRAADTPAPAQAQTGLVKNIQLVTREEFEAVRRFLERRGELRAEVREQIAERIATPLMTRLGIDSVPGLVYSNLLAEIHRQCVEERGFR
jgi:uncharacterized RDD family membrane protein YckC